MRVVELAGLKLVGQPQPRGQVPQQRVLAVPDGQVLVLRRGRDDLDQAADPVRHFIFALRAFVNFNFAHLSYPGKTF